MSDLSIDIIPRFVDQLVSTILDELGRDGVRAVFAGGSVARGEISYCAADSGVDIYSDVDLYVVVGDGVDLEDARRRARDVTTGVPLVGDGYRFYRQPDIGVYTFEDLAAQPARPGTVGLDEHHLILHGDPDVPIQAAARIGNNIAVEESLYLLENRLIELAVLQSRLRRLLRDVSPDNQRNELTSGYYAFTVCKTGVDVASAALIAHGDYVASRKDRLRRLAAMGTGSGSAWAEVRFDAVTRCGDALDRLPSSDWAQGFASDAMAAEVVSLALAVWRRIASGLFDVEADDWSAMVLKRCHTGEYIGNFRQFRAMTARCGFKRRGALAAGVHLSRYSPIDALRLSAILEYLHRDEGLRPQMTALSQTLGPFLERLTAGCGFSEGSLEERAYAMYRATQ
ncbi:MAG: hypothetical protein KAJ17_08325 [Candidatus Krumholzibacteria bacterium]|nr:hypothetical protein [Candidatus Krumholzibacteria bacterium]